MVPLPVHEEEGGEALGEKADQRIVRTTLDSLSAHIALVDASGEIFLTNEAWREFAQANGTPPHEVSEGANYLDVCDSAGRAGVEEAAAFADAPTQKRWFIARATRFLAGDALEVEGAVVTHENITERRLAEEATAHLALHDPLTDLPNRRLLGDRLGLALSRAKREGTAVAVLYLDLEGFKAVNDEFGHEAGDHLLGAVARRLQGCLRKADTAARLGGDEFVVVLEGVGSEGEALASAERIAQVLKEPFLVGGSQRTVTASVGIALSSPPHHEHPEKLLRYADLAMYRSKREGNVCVSLYEASLQEGPTSL